MEHLDLTRVPSGQREWPAFVEALHEIDDRAERYFLEMKSDVDLNTEPGRAKVAKFILGAANRLPATASKRFGGHALLVLGVGGPNPGIPFFEAKDLERTVKKYVGADGPGWDFERVRVDNERDVIIIVVDPPRDGDPAWTCHRDGPENLRDGGIYIRADGETREAKGAEVRVLLERARQSAPTAELEVSLIGEALPVLGDKTVLEHYIEGYRERLLAAYRKHTQPTSAWSLPRTDLMSAFWQPESRSYSQYLAEIGVWENAVRTAWDDVLDDVIGLLSPGVRVCVHNQSETFLDDVEVRVHLDGEVRALRSLDREYDDVKRSLPDPPRPWGPSSKLNFGSQIYPYLPSAPASDFDEYGSITFENGGSVDLAIALRTLRPEERQESAGDDVVLVLPGEDPPERVTGTWSATARGHNEVFRGVVQLRVAEERDLTEAVRRLLHGNTRGEDAESAK